MDNVTKTNYSKSFLIITSLLIINCTIVHKQPIYKINIPQTKDKLQLSVDLIITDDFNSAKLEASDGTWTHISPLGENLINQTEMMAKNVFADVTVNDNPNIALPNNEKRYLLIPKLISVEAAEYYTHIAISSVSKISITIEWKIINGSGKLVWLEATTGIYRGDLRTNSVEKCIQQALNDLFQKSQEEILSSNLLKSLQPKEPQTAKRKQLNRLADIKNENQTEKRPLLLQPTPDQIKLAILPFNLKKNGARYGGPIEGPTIEAIGQALKVNNNYFPVYSYYALGDDFGTKSIDDFISIPSSGELWVNKPFSRKIPNIDLACEIGKKLGADAILLVSVVTSSYGSYDVDYYLIDTDVRSVYKRSDKIHTSRFDANILSFTKLYFGGYREVDY